MIIFLKIFCLNNVQYSDVNPNGCIAGSENLVNCNFLERSINLVGGVENPNKVQGSKIYLSNNCSNSLDFLYDCPITNYKTCYNSCGEPNPCSETVTTDISGNKLKCKSLLNINTEPSNLGITFGDNTSGDSWNPKPVIIFHSKNFEINTGDTYTLNANNINQTVKGTLDFNADDIILKA